MNMYDAIVTGDLELFRKLVNEDTNNVNILTASRRSLLHIAVRHKRVDFIEYLINIGADVNYANEEWWPALMRAFDDGDAKITEILLKAGANIAYINSGGFTALGIPPERNKKRSHECSKLLIDRGAHKHLSTPDMCLDDWMVEFIANRMKNNQSVIALLALHKQRQGPLWFIKQDKHVIKMIGKHIWSIRMLG
jgi:ankyrin repeat protein